MNGLICERKNLSTERKLVGRNCRGIAQSAQQLGWRLVTRYIDLKAFRKVPCEDFEFYSQPSQSQRGVS